MTFNMEHTIPRTFDSTNILMESIREYWNTNLHDEEITANPVGTEAFFHELEAYRFAKLHYLPHLVDFSSFLGKQVLEVGCGLGIDLIQFARGGAIVTGVDIAEVPIRLARTCFEQNGLQADLQVMNGEALRFDDDSFDVVYAHGVLQYTADDKRMIHELFRVLSPGGEAILMVYNKYSWLNALSKLMKIELEHEDAPVLRKYSIGQFKKMLRRFQHVRIVPERFPVRTRLHRGLKAEAYNRLFVPFFQRIPMLLVRPFGWHLLAFAIK
ncbi:MAG: methyltransferase domain-containing protein [Anaerolineales bacterium]|nr:methyltransferase domain-containing protein [Anaerolineales bacterium]